MLGCLPGLEFDEENVQLQPGGLLVVYSDGITEAENAAEEEFGEERLLKVIDAQRQKPAAEIVENIIAAVREFAGPTAQSDDITLLVIKRDNR